MIISFAIINFNNINNPDDMLLIELNGLFINKTCLLLKRNQTKQYNYGIIIPTLKLTYCRYSNDTTFYNYMIIYSLQLKTSDVGVKLLKN